MIKTIPAYMRHLSCWLAGMRRDTRFSGFHGIFSLFFALLVSSFLVVPAGATTVDPPAEESAKIALTTAESGPIFACPNNQLHTVFLDANGSFTLTLQDLDNTYTGSGTINRIQAPQRGTNSSTFTCAEAGNSYQATVRYNEGNGNMTCALTIAVVDNMSPTVTMCAPDVDLSAGMNCDAMLPDYTAAGTFADNCSIATITQSPASGTVLSVLNSVTPVTLTATDPSGSSVTCSFNVMLIDDTPPTVTCPGDITLQTGAGSTDCHVGLPDYTGATVMDNCSTGLTVTQSPAAGTLVMVGDPAIAVTLSSTDASGNTGMCTFMVDAEDTTPPSASCFAGPLTVTLNAMGTGALTPTMVNNGSSDNCTTSLDLALSQTTFDCGDIGSPITVTLTVTDDANLTDQCDVMVNVIDNIDPIAACKNVTIQLDPTGNGTLTVSQVENGSGDACGLDPNGFSLSRTTFDCSDVGNPVDVTYTVTDNNGNTGTCVATITIEDLVAPDAECQNLMLQLDANGMASIGFSGGGSSPAISGTWSVSDPTLFSECGVQSTLSPADGYRYYDQTILDVTGSGSVSLMISSAVATPPMNTGGFNNDNVFVLFYPLGTDFSSPSFDICLASAPLQSYPRNGTQTNTVSLPMGSYETLILGPGGFSLPTSTGTYQFSITSGNASFDGGIPDTDNGSSDACGIASYTLSQTDFTCSDLGVQQVTMTVTDVNGNTATCTSNVDVQDNIDPVANCVAPFSVDLDASGNASITATQVNNNSTDNCGPPSLSIMPSTFSCANVGAPVIVTLTATDAAGNTNTCTTTVTVNDVTAPDALCQDISINLDPLTGMASIVAADIDGGSTDACGPLTLSADITDFDCDDLGPNTVVLKVTDGSSNSMTCNATVSVNDVTPPVVSGCPMVPTGQTYAFELDNDPGVCERDFFFLPPSALDVCSGQITGASVEVSTNNMSNITRGVVAGGITQDFGSFPVGLTEVTYKFTDGSGNESFCIFSVLVRDQQDPGFAQIPSPTANNDQGLCSAVVTFNPPVATDNCPGVFGEQTDATGLESGDAFPVGTTTLEYTATDAGGRTSTITFDVVVTDNELPVFTNGPLDQMVNTDMDQCFATVTALPATATDNCDIATITNDLPATLVPGIHTVTYTATDVNGNAATMTSTITVTDAQAPEAICSSPTVQLDASGNVTISVADIDNGSNDACGILSTSIDINSFDCSNVGMNDVILTVTDNNNNVSTCTAVVTVQDMVAPVVACFSPTIQLDATGTASISVADIDNGSTDNCGIATTSINATSFDCDDVGPNTVILTVTDVNGNVSTCSSTVTVENTVLPMASCQNATIQLDANGSATLAVAQIDGGSSAACGIASITLSQTSFDCSDVGPNTVTLTVTDNDGNVSTCDATVTVEDNVAPTALCKDITVQLDANGVASFQAGDIDDGSSDNCGTITMAVSPSSFDCSMLGGNAVTFTVTDDAGNTASCTSTVTVEDNVAPTALCQDITVQLDANGVASFQAADIDNGSSDNCGTITMAVSPSTFNCLMLGGNPVTFTVTDAAGNSSDCSATVTVEDVELPVITCSGDQEIDADASCAGFVPDYTQLPLLVSATDNCSAVLTQVPAAGTPLTLDVPQSVTVTATDPSGNTDECTFNVTLKDVTPPMITCIANVTGLTNDPGDCDRDFFFDPPVVSDNCEGISASPVTVTVSTNNTTNITQGVVFGGNAGDFGSFPVGITTVTYTATDASGNSATCSFTVEVLDETDPTLGGLPASIDVNNDPGNCSAVVALPFVFPNDNCGVAAVTNNAPAGNLYAVGTTVLTFTVTDVNGNIKTFSTDVNVTDNELPVFTNGPLDQMVNTDMDECFATVTALPATATDNCDIATITNDLPATLVPGIHTVTYTATDVNGNAATMTSTITVTDAQAPEAICFSPTVQLDASGNATITVADIDNGSNDACGILSTSIDVTSFDCTNVGMNDVILTVTDNNNNVSTCTAVVTVQDMVAPVVACFSPTIQLDATGTASISVADIDNGSTDNCGIASTSIDVTSFDCDDVGPNTVILTVTDVNGNVSTCSSTVTVENTVLPMASCQNATIQLDANGSATLSVAQIDGGSSAACGIASTTLSQTSFDCSHVGPNTVTLTVTDNDGNVSTCDATVTVEDNVAPTASCQDVTIQLNANGVASVTPAMVDDNSSDNCAIDTYMLDATSFDCSQIGSNIVTFTVTDAAGNSSSCTSTVTVEDNVAPTALCQDITVQLDANGVASFQAADIDNGSSDNCGITSMTVSPSSFDCSMLGGNAVIFTVTDGTGNSATCSATVTVEDVELPVLTCSGDQEIDADASCAGLVPDYTQLPLLVSATDNCSAVLTQVPAAGTPLTLDVPQSVTVTATDPSMNAVSCTFDVTLKDVTPPMITCIANVTGLTNDPGDCDRDFFYDPPAVSDNCEGISASPVTVTVTTNNTTNITQGVVFGGNAGDFGSFPVGITTVTYTATDASGNSASCSFTVEVLDNTDPVLGGLPTSIDVDNDLGFCSAVVPLPSVFPTDNCVVASVTNDAPVGNLYPVGTTVLTFTVTDVNGNSATFSTDVNVTDAEAPVITQAAGSLDQTVDSDLGVCGAAVTLVDPTSSDNCAVISTTNDAPSVFPVGTTMVTWTASDMEGNTATFTANITVNDVESPVLTQAPSSLDQTVATDPGLCSAAVTLVDPSATDNCMVTSITNDAPATFPVGATVVTWIAADDAGNTATYTATITVTENEAPMFTQAAGSLDQSVGTDQGVCGAALANLATPTATDNCGIAGISSNAPSPFPVGTTLVTWTATDAAGNTATFTATIIVSDDEAPVYANASLDQTVDSDPGICGSTSVVLPTPDATDNCAVVSNTSDAPATFPVGTTLVTWTARDAAGNSATITGNITVVDAEAPVASCQDVTIQLDASGVASVTPTMVDDNSSDNCAIDNYMLDATSFDCSQIGSNIVTFTVTDAAGNSSSCTSTVTVEDNVAPTALCQDITVQLDANGVASFQAADIDNGSSDNCGTITMAVSPSSFDCSMLGGNAVTFTVTDGSGNSATCSATVTVEDNEAPVIACSGDQTVDADASCAGVVPDYSMLPGIISATDNCSAVLTQVPAAGTPLTLGVAQSVTVTAADASGNIDACTFNVTLIDVTPPMITSISDFAGLSNDPGDCDRDFFFNPPTASDNCSGTGTGTGASTITITVSTDNGTNITQGVVFGNNTGDFGSFPVGITTVTYTATDASGNAASSSFTVEVIDNTLPTLSAPASIDVNNDPGVCGAVIAIPNVFASDNCSIASVVNDAPAGNLFPIGTSMLTFVVTDVNGNTATSSVPVTVTDTEAPTITCPADVTVTAAPNQSQVMVAIPVPTASDNCGAPSIVNDQNGTADASGTYPVGTTTVTYTATDASGLVATCSFDVTVNALPNNSVLVAPIVLLQGALSNSSGGLMRDDLRAQGFIPALEPYTDIAGFTHVGGGGDEMVSPSVLAVTGPDAIVDWVFVELRSIAPGFPVLATQSALLQRDGDVVDVDGTSALSFDGVSDGNYFVALRHRNHLGIMTLAPQLLTSGTTTTVDFRSVATFGTNAQGNFLGNVAMWPGNTNTNGTITYIGSTSDFDPVLLDILLDPANTSFDVGFSGTGYRMADANMDGLTAIVGSRSDTDVPLLSILLHPFNTNFSIGFTIFEQLP